MGIAALNAIPQTRGGVLTCELVEETELAEHRCEGESQEDNAPVPERAEAGIFLPILN